MILRLNKHWERISKSVSEEEQIIFLKETISLYEKNPSHTVIVYYALFVATIITFLTGAFSIMLAIVSFTILYLIIESYLYLRRLNKFYNKWR